MLILINKLLTSFPGPLYELPSANFIRAYQDNIIDVVGPCHQQKERVCSVCQPTY